MTKILSVRKCKYINFFYSTQIYREKFSISNSKVCVLSSILIVSPTQSAIFSVPSQPSRFCPSVKMTQILSCGKVSNLRYSPFGIVPISVASSPATTITLCKVALDRLRMTTKAKVTNRISRNLLRKANLQRTYKMRPNPPSTYGACVDGILFSTVSNSLILA